MIQVIIYIVKLPELRQRRNCDHFFAELAYHNPVHGIKYLNGYRYSLLTRLIWSLLIATSVITCTIFIVKTYMKWNTHPEIIGVSEKSSNVWNLPFPAVTICPETKALRSFVNITDGYHITKNNTPPFNLSDEILSRLESLSQVCDPHLFEDANLSNSLSTADPVSTLLDIAVPLEEFALVCKWRNRLVDCFESFKEIVTEEGICYTFNSLHPLDFIKKNAHSASYVRHDDNEGNFYYDIEKNRLVDKVIKTYPQRALGNGMRSGYILVLQQQNIDTDYICKGPVQGFKVAIHNPGELPSFTNDFVRVPLKKEVSVGIEVETKETAKSLKAYSPDRRGCYFNDERSLKYFQYYSKTNCEMECVSNLTLSTCGCVKFSMIRNKDTPVCGQQSIKCYDRIQDSFAYKELSAKFKKNSTYVGCNCLPSCDSDLKYKVEISQAEFDYENLLIAYQNEDEMHSQLSRLNIFFKYSDYTTIKYVESYNYLDFLASIGGFLALFLGISILSVIEIFQIIFFRRNSRTFTYDERNFENEDLMTKGRPEVLFRKSGNIPQTNDLSMHFGRD